MHFSMDGGILLKDSPEAQDQDEAGLLACGGHLHEWWLHIGSRQEAARANRKGEPRGN